MASALFEIQRNKREAVAIYLVWIHFDAFFEIPAKDFYFASTDQNVDFPVDNTGDKEFKGKFLKDIPKGRHQKERDNDMCEFAFINRGNETYQEFLAYKDIIKRGKVHVYHCLEVAKDYYEGEIRFYGYLKTFILSESDKSLRFTAESDMSRKGFPVGARILTRERCGTEFSFGLVPPDAPQGCTWQTEQGGNPNHCSKFLKGVDSCVAHGNAHQFFAVTALSTATITFVPSSEVDFPYDNDSCFTENNLLMDADWNVYPISFAKKGNIIKGFDIFTGKIVDTEILDVYPSIVEEYEIAYFQSGAKLEVTRDHLFNVKNSDFAPIGALRGKTVLGLDKKKKDASDRLTALQTVSERVTVYHLHTTSNTFIITDTKAIFRYKVHNLKEHLPVNL